jgi:hypothetical protein
MGIELLTDRFADQIVGVLSCYDRLIIQGTIPDSCYWQAMTNYLNAHHIRIFDYPHFAQPLRDQLREHAERVAAENGIPIEFIRKSGIRKSDKIQEIIDKRGSHPGLVAILSVMEPCSTYKPWHDKGNGKTFLRPGDGKCLHYYFYFIDKQLGLCNLRVPTWCPFRLQFYCNGHYWLATRPVPRAPTLRSLRATVAAFPPDMMTEAYMCHRLITPVKRFSRPFDE